LATSVQLHAQESGVSHAGNFRARLKAQYLDKREWFLHRVKDLYFAAGCKVLASEAGILPLTSPEFYLAYIGDQTIIETKDEVARQEAVREEEELARNPANAITIGGIRRRPGEVVKDEMPMQACMLSQPSLADWKERSIYRGDQWRIRRIKCAPGDYVPKEQL
jgi:hypothetical protein